jgi:hypothetical protein
MGGPNKQAMKPKAIPQTRLRQLKTAKLIYLNCFLTNGGKGGESSGFGVFRLVRARTFYIR